MSRKWATFKAEFSDFTTPPTAISVSTFRGEDWFGNGEVVMERETTPCIHLRPVFIVMAVGCSTLFLLGPVIVAVLIAVFAPLDVSIFLAPGAIAFAVIMAWAMSSSVQWVELDGGAIRARKLLTRRIVTHNVSDIVGIKPLNSNMMGPLENALADMMMGTSNRGYELRFRDGSKLGLVRGDMKGLDEFLLVLAAEIAARCGPFADQ